MLPIGRYFYLQTPSLLETLTLLGIEDHCILLASTLAHVTFFPILVFILIREGMMMVSVEHRAI